MDYRHCVVLFLTAVSLIDGISAHIVLTYPPARKYALDYLNNLDTPEPCGMPRGLSAPTFLEAGTEVNVTWFSAYPHQGGYMIDLLDGNYDRVLVLVPASVSGREGRGGPEMLQWEAGSLTDLTRSILLPRNLRCDNCTLRIIRQALEWNNATADPEGFLFRSCADVSILPQVDGAVKCSTHGTWTGTECLCDDLYTGNACQYKETCNRDSDCNFHGRCINTGTNAAPKKSCFCASGWKGLRCSEGSSVRIRVFNKAYYTHSPLADDFDLYWKIDKDVAEIEMIVQSRSVSWIGIGWRPLDMSSECRRFPRLPQETYWPHGAAAVTPGNHTPDGTLHPRTLDTAPTALFAPIRPRRSLPEGNASDTRSEEQHV